MYNLRARTRTALSGSVRTQGARVRSSRNWTSQVTPTQALEILDSVKETVPGTELPASDVSDVSEVSTSQLSARNMLKSDAASQPPPHRHRPNTFGSYSHAIGFYSQMQILLFQYMKHRALHSSVFKHMFSSSMQCIADMKSKSLVVIDCGPVLASYSQQLLRLLLTSFVANCKHYV